MLIRVNPPDNRLDSPISTMVRDTRTVALGQVTPQQSADYGGPRTNNHKRDPSGKATGEIGKQEDANPRIHQNRQHNS